MSNLFESAARNRFRFNSPKGELTVEDLYALPLTSSTGKANLDDIAKGLYSEIKAAGEVQSFVGGTKKADTTILEEKFELVKYVIDTIVAEREAKNNADKFNAQMARLRELIERRREENLSASSVEDLERMLSDLNGAAATE